MLFSSILKWSGKIQKPFSLLTVSDEINQHETVRKLKILYDNFEANSSIDEIVTDEEIAEETEFISSLLQTSVMK